MWHYPHSGSCPSSIIAQACNFFSASISQRVSEAPGLGVERGLVKMEILGHHAVLGAAGGEESQVPWLAVCCSRLINHHLQACYRTFQRPFLHFRLWKITASLSHLSSPWQVPFSSGNSDSGSTGGNGSGKVKRPLQSYMLHVKQMWLRSAELCRALPCVYDRKLHC